MCSTCQLKFIADHLWGSEKRKQEVINREQLSVEPVRYKKRKTHFEMCMRGQS
jgi:hypothetical protein